MPIYTIENTKTKKVEDIVCSFDELKKITEDPDIIHVIQPTGTITNQTGDQLKKAGAGWKDLLGRIKKGSGKDSTINI